MNQFPRSQIHIILNDFSEFLRIFLELFSDFLRSEVNQKFFLAILSSILVNNFKLVEIFVQFSKLLIFLSLTSENLSKLSSDSFSFSAFIKIWGMRSATSLMTMMAYPEMLEEFEWKLQFFFFLITNKLHL